MSSSLFTSQIGQRISLPGHFDVPVVLEDARLLGSDDSTGFECRVRLPDGSLEEAVISSEEVTALLYNGPGEAKRERLKNALATLIWKLLKEDKTYES